jgi:chromosome segregation ATPase
MVLGLFLQSLATHRRFVLSMLTQDQASESAVGGELPTFPTALRGYDKTHVDVFVHEQHSRLAAERERADQAERAAEESRNQPPATFEHLGAEAAKVLEQAGNSATVLLQEARARGESVVEEARAQAAELIKTAQERQSQIEEARRQTADAAADEGKQILAKANDEAQRVRSQAEEEARSRLAEVHEGIERARQQAEAELQARASEIERLGDHRDRLRDDLARAYHDLGRVLARSARSDAEASDQVQVASAGQEEPVPVAAEPGDVEPSPTTEER